MLLLLFFNNDYLGDCPLRYIVASEAAFLDCVLCIYVNYCLVRLMLILLSRIYEMECWLNVPNKFRHPSYETLNWYAAQHLLEDLKGLYNNITCDHMPYVYTSLSVNRTL